MDQYAKRIPLCFQSEILFILCYALIKQNHFVILATTPAPTVLPPSRIAKRCPSSIAIGVMSFTLISMLSPGMHISTPSGRLMSPVTSVVLKKNCGRYPLKNGVWRPPSSLVRTYTCAVNSVCGCTVPGLPVLVLFQCPYGRSRGAGLRCCPLPWPGQGSF